MRELNHSDMGPAPQVWFFITTPFSLCPIQGPRILDSYVSQANKQLGDGAGYRIDPPSPADDGPGKWLQNEIYAWKPKTKNVISLWHLAPCMIVDIIVSLIVGELECSSVTELCGVLSCVLYTAFLVNARNIKDDFLKNTLVL